MLWLDTPTATAVGSGLACVAGRLSGSSRGKTSGGANGGEASTESTCRREDVAQLG